MSEGYDNTNRGALFKPREGEDGVSLSGSINIDGEDKRVILVKRKSQNGKVYWEMYEKIGQVFRSSSDNPKAPVIHGVVGTIDHHIGIKHTRVDHGKISKRLEK